MANKTILMTITMFPTTKMNAVVRFRKYIIKMTFGIASSTYSLSLLSLLKKPTWFLHDFMAFELHMSTSFNSQSGKNWLVSFNKNVKY